MVPSSEFFEESNLADLNSKPLWAICLSVARICGAGEALRSMAILTPRAGTFIVSGSFICPIYF